MESVPVKRRGRPSKATPDVATAPKRDLVKAQKKPVKVPVKVPVKESKVPVKEPKEPVKDSDDKKPSAKVETSMKSIQKKLTDFDKIQAEQKKKLDKIHALVDKLG